jgi:hypothetical protein
MQCMRSVVVVITLLAVVIALVGVSREPVHTSHASHTTAGVLNEFGRTPLSTPTFAVMNNKQIRLSTLLPPSPSAVGLSPI